MTFDSSKYINKFLNADSLVDLQIEPGSIDLILEDMPYNTTACEWDVKIDLQRYWETRLETLKQNGVIVLTASQPFTTDLISSNRTMFKYEWVWDKKMVTGLGNVAFMPMKCHENVLVFYKSKPTYNPIKRKVSKPFGKHHDGEVMRIYGGMKNIGNRGVGYPKSIIEIPRPNNLTDGGLHPTQKPVELFEYLIRTYTNQGDLVFDGFAGSGTTAIACIKSNRDYICYEKDKKYFDIACKRIKQFESQLKLAI
jgi:site-specific DNA-methyltransferase (adenine-specific)